MNRLEIEQRLCTAEEDCIAVTVTRLAGPPLRGTVCTHVQGRRFVTATIGPWTIDIDYITHVEFNLAEPVKRELDRLRAVAEAAGQSMLAERGSGRTQRILEQAVAAARERKEVVVLAAHQAAARELKRRASLMTAGEVLRLEVKPFDALLDDVTMAGRKNLLIIEDHTVPDAVLRWWESRKAVLT